ncbi:DUF6146 family protein [Prevotella sp. 10(H)]|uniref:DUF6146 family protein n=1 Tax=Prevotella sp. 10(H) TaxID=1158294 RepID=UPI00068ABED3|nr:DUF6146 family protein [Prevotella sp. 10(H)]
MKKGSVIFILLLLLMQVMYGQSLTVTGTVVDAEDMQAVERVPILNQNTNIIYWTDENGKYSLKANKGDTLKFSLVGYVTKKIIVEKNIHDIIFDLDCFILTEPDPVNFDGLNSGQEYEAIVLEPGYETFLATQQSMNFFSESTLKTKNTFLVSEWNYRCDNPMRYSPQVYEAKVDYDPKNEYGLETEYRLYMFFRFMDKKYDLGLERR